VLGAKAAKASGGAASSQGNRPASRSAAAPFLAGAEILAVSAMKWNGHRKTDHLGVPLLARLSGELQGIAE